MSDGATSQPHRSGSDSSSWSPRQHTQAVFFQIDDDPQHFPGHDPPPLPPCSRGHSTRSPAPSHAPKTALPAASVPARTAPRPSLLDVSDSSPNRPDLDSARTQFHTPAAPLPTAPSPASAAPASHDLLGGFSQVEAQAADLLGTDVFATPAATPEGGGGPSHAPVDFLGIADGPAPPPALDTGAGLASHDLLGGMHAEHVSAGGEVIDYDFFAGGSAAEGGAAAATGTGLSDADWLMAMAEGASDAGGTPTVPAACGGRGSAAGAAEPDEPGDVMLERVVGEAQAAMVTLPADRAQRVRGAIQQAREYVEEQAVRPPPPGFSGLLWWLPLAAATAAAAAVASTTHAARLNRPIPPALRCRRRRNHRRCHLRQRPHACHWIDDAAQAPYLVALRGGHAASMPRAALLLGRPAPSSRACRIRSGAGRLRLLQLQQHPACTPVCRAVIAL